MPSSIHSDRAAMVVINAKADTCTAMNGKTPVEMVGRVSFPKIGELPYFVTLPPFGFYWFSLVDELGDDLTDE